jgi:hypothetical protein
MRRPEIEEEEIREQDCKVKEEDEKGMDMH